MPLYTRTGDQGETSLFGGDRVPKTDPRIEAYGTVDELNAVIGWAAVTAENGSKMGERLQKIQDNLFKISASLSNPNGNPPTVSGDDVEWLEKVCDTCQAATPTLEAFILPGGCELAGRLHVARTVCRRAERRVTTLSEQQTVPEHVLPYVNRLSDALFSLARRANHEAGVEEDNPSYT